LTFVRREIPMWSYDCKLRLQPVAEIIKYIIQAAEPKEENFRIGATAKGDTNHVQNHLSQM
jgi:hypothetical protein